MKKKKLIYKLFIILLGCVIAAFGLNAFLIPSSIAAGGFSGISILINSVSGIPVGLILLVLNFPLFIVAFKRLGKNFVIISLFGTIAYSLIIDLFGFIPSFTEDLLLCSVYGGVCVGAGYGIILKYGATTGGTDLLATILSDKWEAFPIGQLMFMMDLCVIICSALLIGMDRGLYAIISVFVSSKVIDIILQGTRKAKGFFIITNKGEEIARDIMNDLERGVTLLNGKGAYTGNDRDVLICALNSRTEISQIKELIYKNDENAFVLIGDMTEIMGEGF